ncbi:MAG: flagellar biosynthesis protein FlhB [Chitinivibrionales bacterium]|nr:flagellar biosynthesis protein FlhB [Chitinivibrionales bacterium]
MAEESFDEKTEPASDKKRQESRNKGSVAKSSEVNSVAVLAAALFLLKIFGPWMYHQLDFFCRTSFQMIAHPKMDMQSFLALSNWSILFMGKVCMPVVLGILVVGVLANIIQVGFLFTMEPLMPKMSKINPFTGIGRLISLQSLVELLKSILKIVIIGFVAYIIMKDAYPKFLVLSDVSVGAMWLLMLSVAYKIFFWITMILIVLAVLDFAYQRFDFEKKLRMTRQEVKEERKQMDGDPQIKARVRSLQREMARRRMMEAVPKATVVVTNPTYIAIAIRYESAEMNAPVVVAKGKRHQAERIRALAAENNIPIYENKPLARAMYDKVEPGMEVPMEFYTAVAEILAYVYRLKTRKAA